MVRFTKHLLVCTQCKLDTRQYRDNVGSTFPLGLTQSDQIELLVCPKAGQLAPLFRGSPSAQSSIWDADSTMVGDEVPFNGFLVNFIAGWGRLLPPPSRPSMRGRG